VSVTSGDRKYLTEEELVKFLKGIDSIRDRAIFTVMYWRGLRASEIGKLQLSSWRQAAGRLFVTRGKGSLAGEFALSPAETKALKAWIRVRGQNPGALFPSREASGTVGISRFMLHALMRQYGQRASLPDNLCHCHALKHSIGTHLVAKVDLLSVKDWLGHKDIKSTMVYLTYRSKQRDRVAAEVYEGVG
jgi:site-specific recombinase XerC